MKAMVYVICYVSVLKKASPRKPHLNRVFKVRKVFARKGGCRRAFQVEQDTQRQRGTFETGHVGLVELLYSMQAHGLPNSPWSRQITSTWP